MLLNLFKNDLQIIGNVFTQFDYFNTKNIPKQTFLCFEKMDFLLPV